MSDVGMRSMGTATLCLLLLGSHGRSLDSVPSITWMRTPVGQRVQAAVNVRPQGATNGTASATNTGTELFWFVARLRVAEAGVEPIEGITTDRIFAFLHAL